MTLLERVVRGHRCRSTHHFIAFDALSLIGGEQGEAWKSVFLVHHEHLLEGAKAPDAVFKDFKNHVCHVNEGQWGGARDKATEWYARAVELLAARQWSKAAYALGVLSHYYADPIQPFHTGQTEEEGVIHRAVEWSIAKSRSEIDARIEAAGYPDVTVPEGPGFVADMVLEGALLANAHYQMMIDHYDVHRGASNPPEGLDDTMRDAIAELVAYATAGFAALISRAIEEAAVAPPKVSLTLQGYIETLDIPLRWITAKLEDAADRATVTKMYKEFCETGKVIKSLPADDKLIRKLHAKQVLRIPLKQLDAQEIAPLGTLHVAPEGEAVEAEIVADEVVEVAKAPPPVVKAKRKEPEAAPALAIAPVAAADEDLFEGADEPLVLNDEDERLALELIEAEAGVSADAEPEQVRGPRLTRESDVVDAPSIGKKTAKRLARAGITTIADLLDCDIEETAFQLDVHYIDSETLRDWQDQTKLMMAVPGLRTHDVQILVGAGIRTAKELAEAPARTLFLLASEFLNTPEGERVLRYDDTFAEDEVEEWIERAKEVA